MGKEGLKKNGGSYSGPFVSDCLENTRRNSHGGRRDFFTKLVEKNLTPYRCLNDRDSFAQLLANWVEDWQAVNTDTAIA